MTLKDFCELLDVHGSDLRKWPNDRRAAALTLLDRSDAAKKAFADACGFDAALLSDDDGLSEAHRQSLIDGIMQAVGPTEGQEEAPKTCPDQPGRETGAALSSGRLIELFAGFVPLAPDDPKGQPTRRDRIAEFLHGVIDSALQGPGRGDALAALAHRERAYEDALQAIGGPESSPLTAGDSMAAAFIGGGLTEDAVEGWTATRKAVFDAQLRLISGVLADLSDILDRADRERFMTEVGRRLRDQ